MKIKHVYGNVLKLDIPLTIKIRTMEDDVPTEREEPFYPDVSKGCTVILGNSYNRKIQYDATVSGNVAHIEDDGVIGIGTYKVTVKCYDEEGNPYRYMVRDIIEICDATIDAGIEAGVEFNVETYTLEGAVFVSYGVEQVQSDWNEQDDESKAFIKNKPDLTQYATKNELREVESEIPTLPDHIVTDEHYVHTDNNYTTEEKTKLAGLENYDDTNVLNLIEQTNQNFANYYTKQQTYSQSEVNHLLETQRQGQYVMVEELPEASADTQFKIYLVPSEDAEQGNIKDEYITIDNGSGVTTRYTWEKIGSTDVDLSGYSTTEEMNAAIQTALADYYTKTEADALLGGKQDTISDLSTIRSGAQAGATAYQKPTNGIPKTDLAQDVKDSLDLADTALQEDTLYGKVNNNGHEYVDLGLPSGTLWAKCNVGADAETGYGNYYMYGKGARQYNSSDSPYTGNEDPLDSSVDTAAQVWGGSWRMPTQAQMRELTANTTYRWVTNYKGSGINGGTFTATNGAVLFIPAAGRWSNGSQNDVGRGGNYWGSSPDGSNGACHLGFSKDGRGVNNVYRKSGYSVRGVILPDTTQLKKDLDSKANTEDLADVAFSGSYNDLDDKPTIPTVPTNVSAFNNDAGYLTQHQDISGKADKSEMSVTDGTGTDADKTTITLKTGTSATVLKSHQSLSGKQDVIDSSHKLSADLVDDTNTTNKFTNATEKQTWNNKQDALTFNTAPSSNNKVATMADVPTTMGASGSGHKGGLVPDTPSTAGTTKFLREDGTWQEPAGGSAAAYTPTLQSAPTSSTTTYTKDGQTVDFEIGQFARVANQDNPTGYDMWQLYDLVTENDVTTAVWRSTDAVIGDINTILDNINGEVI